VSWEQVGGLLAVLAGWFVVTRWILPRLGVPT
jgi:hypothetical protein